MVSLIVSFGRDNVRRYGVVYPNGDVTWCVSLEASVKLRASAKKKKARAGQR